MCFHCWKCVVTQGRLLIHPHKKQSLSAGICNAIKWMTCGSSLSEICSISGLIWGEFEIRIQLETQPHHKSDLHTIFILIICPLNIERSDGTH
jgi:hypothetical protein